VEKLIGLPKLIESNRKLAIPGWLVTMFFVVVGWVLFRAHDLPAAKRYLLAMFGLTEAGFCDYDAVFHLMELRVLLPVGVLASVPWLRHIPRRGLVPYWVAQVLLFLGAVSCLVMNVHNPFIYFNF
jgi:hypothetical protein